LEWDRNIGPILFLNIKNRKFGFCFCHRIKDRSIWFFGLEKVFCSRCLGILFGGIIGLILAIFQYRMEFLGSVLLMIPLIIDGFSQALNYRDSNNVLRFITGFFFGIGLQFFLATLFAFIKNGFLY
jgi:uncharacterized membrane protein